MKRRKLLMRIFVWIYLVAVSVIFNTTLAGEEGGLIIESPKFWYWSEFSNDNLIKVNVHTMKKSQISARFFTDDLERLYYEVTQKGNKVLESSPLGIFVDGIDLGAGVEIQEPIKTESIKEVFDHRGNHSKYIINFESSLIPVMHKASGKEWNLEVRAFHGGLAFRYVIPSEIPATISGEATAFAIPAGSIVYYQENMRNYEGVHKKEKVEKAEGVAGMPLTVELPGGAGFLAITEAALYNWSGMALEAQDRMFRARFLDDETWRVEPKDGMIVSPWRVVIAVNSLNGLVNSDIVNNLNPVPSEELFKDADEWIRPGRALWSWWSQWTGDLELQKHYADAAAEMGFEYILVDEGWEDWTRDGEDHWQLIAELCDYAAAKGVGVWVWKRWPMLGDQAYRRDYFRRVKEAGAVGVKIDFMDSESKDMIEFYEAALRDAAKEKLMVNFHGANKPTGESRTYPNEMTREGIRGLEYNRLVLITLPARYNATLPFTRFIAGHADYTPVTFNPKKMGRTSYAHQLATAIVFLSPLTHWADRPENFMDNPATAPALDVIKSIPTVWDETIVLEPSAIGEVAAFARRSGDTWFVGVLNGGKQKTINIDLSFLGQGSFRAVILSDRMNDRTAFERSERNVDSGTALDVRMRKGGGFAAMLSPQE